MQLKRLNLLGFKTFADKTEIEIGEGLTAIVGPNGSGKSNIVDALLWVLGEQNPRLLRGDKAQDVIFAGSDTRKALGMAEVRLTIDNHDRQLPVDFAEVVITRRIFRSGESQYLLNGAAVRLRDITELFLDTGMGRGAYSVVGQHEIDAVLSAKSEDRRELFEEAAGIKKYRAKKREALRRLDTAETNLQRIADIISELNRQRVPLEKQALAAARYIKLKEDLAQIEIGLLVAEIHRADYELAATREEREAIQGDLLDLDGQLIRLERLAEDADLRMQDADEALNTAQKLQLETSRYHEQLRSQVALLQERVRSTTDGRDQLTAEIAELKLQAERQETMIAADEADLSEAAALYREVSAKWSVSGRDLRDQEDTLRQTLKEIETHQSLQLRRERERSDFQRRLTTEQLRLENITTERGQLEDEAEALAEQISGYDRRQQVLQQQIAELKQQSSQHRTELAAVKDQFSSASIEITRSREDVDLLRRKSAEHHARLQTLQELQQSHDGFYQGVKAVLDAVRRGELTGFYQPLVELLEVPEKYRVAVEVALGGSLQDVVTLTERESRAGIDWLKAHRAGRVTFLPLPLLRPPQPLSVQAGRGLEGAALDLVAFDERYYPAAALLLGRTIIANTLDAAIEASKRLSGWSRLVTVEGEVITPGGALTGGSLQGRGSHLLGRKGEIDDLQERLPSLTAKLREAQDREGAHRLLAVQLEDSLAHLNKAGAELEKQEAILTSQLDSVTSDLQRVSRQKQQTLHKLEAIAAKQKECDEQLRRLDRTQLDAQVDNDEVDSILTDLQTLSVKQAARRDESRAETVALEVQAGQLQAKVRGLEHSLKTERDNLSSIRLRLSNKEAALAGLGTTGADAAAELERVHVAISQAMAACSSADAQESSARTYRATVAEESAANNRLAREVQTRREKINNDLHATEMRLARLEMALTQASERLSSEYGIGQDQALKMPDDAPPEKQATTEVTRLRREIRLMGDVNIGAGEEFDRLTERLTFLEEQQADLEQGRSGLLDTIHEIDTNTHDVFLVTFHAVQREFQLLFNKLFGGGTTNLILTQPENILETGIDVMVHPPGKKPQSLALLSGGERALTAAALLFAFLRVRPSPFVLLDEVDAPLDGANVERFIGLLQDFSSQTQVLVITHNPATMEAAPTWYGVSMKVAGVSHIVSYRVPSESLMSAEDRALVLDRQ